MSEKTFAALLNEQVAHEFAAHQQYIALAVYYDGETLPRLASFYYRQAVEERNHAMMIVQYLLDADHPVTIPAVEAPADVVLRHRRAGRARARPGEARDRADQRARRAGPRADGDYQGEQFMQWFIKEQTEEVSTASDLLKVVQRSKDNPLLAEEYLARESLGDEGGDPTAPGAAGGAL